MNLVGPGRILLLGAILLAPTLAAQPAPHTLHVRYDLGGTFAGNVTGACEASGILLPSETAGNIILESAGGQVLNHTVHANSTRSSPPGTTPTELLVAGHVEVAQRSVFPGPGTITWEEAGRIVVLGSPAPWDLATDTFEARFETTRFSTGTLADSIPGVSLYRELAPNHIIPSFRPIEGPQRVTTLADGMLTAQGNLTVYLEGATVSVEPGTPVVVPPRYEMVAHAGLPAAAEVFVTRVHYGFLELRDAVLKVPVEGAQLVCRGLDAHVDGSVNLSLARGTILRPEGNLSFEEQELGIVGTFDWAEQPEDRGVAATGNGHIESATLDFGTVHQADSLTLAEMGLWAALLAFLGSVLYFVTKGFLAFFSRLTENRVARHPGRALVLETVRANPNVTLRALTSRTGLHKSVVRYHARVLEAKGLVRSHRVIRDRCFVAKDTLRAEGRRLLKPSRELVLKNDEPLEFITRAVPSEGIRFFQLARRLGEELGLTKQGAWKAVVRAEERGLVMRERRGREVWVQCVS